MPLSPRRHVARFFPPLAPLRAAAMLALAVPLALSACSSASDTAEEGATQSGPATVTVSPPVGGLGTTMELDLSASRSFFAFDGTTVDLGDGITVDSVTVSDGWGATALVTIDPGAELGDRDVVLSTGGRTKTLSDAFEVIAESFTVTPSTARIGETAQVDLVGVNTAWEQGTTWPSFGDGVTVDEFTVLSETLASATISVDPTTLPGWRNVVVDAGGGSVVTAYDGLLVDRVALAATFDPKEAEQGDTVEFTIQARGTSFREDRLPQITFVDRFGENPDIVVDSMVWLDAENVYGQMTLSNAAALGSREVRLNNGDEGIVIPEAFEVIGGDWSIDEVAIDLSFTVQRVKDNTTGEVSESVRASCMFYIPLDPPCPGPPSGGGPPPPSVSKDTELDSNGYGGAESAGGGGGGEDDAEDCPFPTTIPAGDVVWLESESNVVTLEKVEDASTGMTYYQGQGLTIADYVPGEVYDLHTQGEPEGEGIGEYLLDDVLYTVPRDWEWLTPDLWGNYVHNRAEPFTFKWTPTGSYPDGLFVVDIFTERNPGPLAQENWFGYLQAFPFDDGTHQFSAAEMSFLAPGQVPVNAYTFRQGPEFGLPGSIYQTNQAVSYILLAQTMFLE